MKKTGTRLLLITKQRNDEMISKTKRRNTELAEISAMLYAPDGTTDQYTVDAYSKADARKKIAKIFRDNTPPPSAGFYPFSQMRLVWID